jgi:hypothetical protein
MTQARSEGVSPIKTAGELIGSQLIMNTFGYAAASIFVSSAISLLNWTALLGATTVGALVLYLPFAMALGVAKTYGFGTPFIYLMMVRAFELITPVMGAALLNAIFAWSIPALACVICVGLGIGIGVVSDIFFPPNNQQNTNASTPTPTSSRQASSEPTAQSARDITAILPQEALLFSMFASQMENLNRRTNSRRGVRGAGLRHNSASYPTQYSNYTHNATPATSRQSSVIIEELDENGNVISRGGLGAGNSAFG